MIIVAFLHLAACVFHTLEEEHHKFSKKIYYVFSLGIVHHSKVIDALDKETNKVFISKHVVFNENVFHFLTNKSSNILMQDPL